MERHEAGITTDRQMQRGDIAVADERLDVVAQQFEINAIEQPRCAVTTAQANDGIDFIISECPVQVIEPHLIAAGQVAVLLVDAGENLQ
ncbi:hypothetical protein D3C87_1410010 [compost metagenome]